MSTSLHNASSDRINISSNEILQNPHGNIYEFLGNIAKVVVQECYEQNYSFMRYDHNTITKLAFLGNDITIHRQLHEGQLHEEFKNSYFKAFSKRPTFMEGSPILIKENIEKKDIADIIEAFDNYHKGLLILRGRIITTTSKILHFASPIMDEPNLSDHQDRWIEKVNRPINDGSTVISSFEKSLGDYNKSLVIDTFHDTMTMAFACCLSGWTKIQEKDLSRIILLGPLRGTITSDDDKRPSFIVNSQNVESFESGIDIIIDDVEERLLNHSNNSFTNELRKSIDNLKMSKKEIKSILNHFFYSKDKIQSIDNMEYHGNAWEYYKDDMDYIDSLNDREQRIFIKRSLADANIRIHRVPLRTGLRLHKNFKTLASTFPKYQEHSLVFCANLDDIELASHEELMQALRQDIPFISSSSTSYKWESDGKNMKFIDFDLLSSVMIMDRLSEKNKRKIADEIGNQLADMERPYKVMSLALLPWMSEETIKNIGFSINESHLLKKEYDVPIKFEPSCFLLAAGMSCYHRTEASLKSAPSFPFLYKAADRYPHHAQEMRFKRSRKWNQMESIILTINDPTPGYQKERSEVTAILACRAIENTDSITEFLLKKASS